MIKAEVIHPARLTAEDRATWRRWQPAPSPLLGPAFAQLVGELRPDARVALLEDGGERVGFLAFQGRGAARPIGAPFSDYQAMIGQAPAAEALRAAGVAAYRFAGLIDPRGLMGGVEGEPGYLVEQGGDAYLAGLDGKRLKNWRRLTNKIERELGPLELRMDDRDPAAFAALLKWKSDQLRRSGKHDVLRGGWGRELMTALFARTGEGLKGRMMTLSAGGRLLAGHFGAEEGGVCHSWISSMDPDAGVWSPGQALLFHLIGQMPEAGLKTLDLGPSHGHYKAPFCTTLRPTRCGVVTAASPAGRLSAAADRAFSLVDRAAPAFAATRRRLDHIAATERSAAGRVRGVIDAVAGRARRHRLGAAAEA